MWKPLVVLAIVNLITPSEEYDCAKNEILDPCFSDCPSRICGVNIAAVSCLAIDDCDCKPACRCSDGYLRNSEGDCVLECDCPPVCGKDEVYSACTNSDCQPKNCSQLGYPIPCPGPAACVKGCSCKQGYLRAANGTCIPKEKCPSCGGDPNAVPGCGQNCGRRCSDYNSRKPVICADICELNGCDCKVGFVLDDSTGKCVRPNQCAPVCGKDEVYSACTNSDCQPKNCFQLGYPTPYCPRIDPAYCIQGCSCKPGYLRAANGTCIPKEKCPSCGGDPNAVSGCGQNCGRRCSNYNSKKPVICADICELNGCDCKEGFLLDDNTGKCVRPNQCGSVSSPRYL